jgi:hypothetical protein
VIVSVRNSLTQCNGPVMIPYGPVNSEVILSMYPWWWPGHGRNICRVNWTKYENKKIRGLCTGTQPQSFKAWIRLCVIRGRVRCKLIKSWWLYVKYNIIYQRPMIGEVRYIWHSSGALKVLAPALMRSAFLRSLYNLLRLALVNLGFSDSFWIFLSNDIHFLHFCSYFLCNFSTLWKFSSTQHSYRLITLQIVFYRLLLLNNIVDPVILYTSTPISTSYLFAIQSYTAQTSRGVAIFSVHAQALPLPPHGCTPPLPTILDTDINPLSNKI